MDVRRLTGLCLSGALHRLLGLDVERLVQRGDGAEEQRDSCCDGREAHDVRLVWCEVSGIRKVKIRSSR